MPTRCKGPIDITFVIDGSASAEYNTHGGFRRTLKLVKEFANNFIVSPQNTRFGLVVFATKAGTIFKFETHSTKDSLLLDIDKIKFPGTTSFLGKGLQQAKEDVLVTRRPKVPQKLIVITDALSHDNPFSVANEIKAMNVEIFAVSVGIRSNQTILQTIVSQPVSNHMFSSKQRLDELMKAVKQGACKGTKLYGTPHKHKEMDELYPTEIDRSEGPIPKHQV